MRHGFLGWNSSSVQYHPRANLINMHNTPCSKHIFFLLLHKPVDFFFTSWKYMLTNQLFNHSVATELEVLYFLITIWWSFRFVHSRFCWFWENKLAVEIDMEIINYSVNITWEEEIKSLRPETSGHWKGISCQEDYRIQKISHFYYISYYMIQTRNKLVYFDGLHFLQWQFIGHQSHWKKCLQKLEFLSLTQTKGLKGVIPSINNKQN